VPQSKLQKFIEAHLASSEPNSYKIELGLNEVLFAQEHFTNFEEYLAIKALAYFGADQSALNPHLGFQYFQLRKRLYANQLIFPSENELKFLRGIETTNQAKVSKFEYTDLHSGTFSRKHHHGNSFGRSWTHRHNF
jgi:hypothetical protein